jgi:parallel beta-helix repeat protein
MTTQASVTVYDANQQPLTGRTVTWSTNGSVATVNSTGLITAAAPGTTTITATCEGISKSVTLTVVASSTTLPPGPTVTLTPSQSIQSAVNANPSGTVFVLTPGTYLKQTVIPKSGDVFYGQPGAILDGGGVTPYAIWTGTSSSIPSNVRIHGLIVRNYNTEVQLGAISAGGHDASVQSRGWVVDSCEIRDNAAAGIRLGHRMRIFDNNIHHNNQIGIVGLSDSTVIENNELAFNNYRKVYTLGWEAGGVKFLKSRGTTLRGNYVHDNWGPGLWADTDVWDALYENNRVENNGGEGIFHEVSYRAIIRNNRVVGNGFGSFEWLYGAGIMVSTSRDVEVVGNTVIDNARGITAVMQNRGSDGFGVHTLDNVYVHDNYVTMRATAIDVDGVGAATGLAQDVGDLSYFTGHNNRFANNKYTLGTASRYFAWMNGQRTEAQWQAYGQDVTGTFTR